MLERSSGLRSIKRNSHKWYKWFIRPFGGVLVGTDAVALKILDDQREKDGRERIAPRVPHLALAEKLGLGKSRLEDIELEAINLG